MHFPGISYELIKGDQEIVEGIEAIELPGHTPAVLGLLVHLEKEVVIFPSDAVYTSKNYGPPSIAPGIIYDSLGFQRSVDKLRSLERKHHAKIIFAHDLEQFETLKKGPAGYAEKYPAGPSSVSTHPAGPEDGEPPRFPSAGLSPPA